LSDLGECSVCFGTGKNMFNENCTYCNGTSEHNILADEYLKNYICQCITWDRKNCPVCKKVCHHDSSQTPKQKIDPGYGGMSNVVQLDSSQGNFTISSETQEEELVIV